MLRLIKTIFWWLKAISANLVYGFPSKKIFLIGVTGTDGKTSTTTLIHHILRFNGFSAGYITSVEAQIGDWIYDTGFHVTTPSPWFIQKALKQSILHKDQYFVLEVTAHAITQLRILGCRFKIAALTNITPEHLDYYRNYQQYAKTKCRFINHAEIAVVNKEASTFYRYEHYLKNKNIWTSAVNKPADVVLKELKKNHLRSQFVGFELENVCLAYTVAKTLGIPELDIIRAINTFKRVKGRLDFVTEKGVDFLIDFAHTPNAFSNLFASLKGKYPKKRLIHVFGCAGERDRVKRSSMGEISGRNAQITIITEEDYRTEKPEAIFQEIEKGIKKNPEKLFNRDYYWVADRQEAINLAVRLAKKNDLIILTGKAHEKSLCRGKTEYPWDEYEALKKAIENKKQK